VLIAPNVKAELLHREGEYDSRGCRPVNDFNFPDIPKRESNSFDLKMSRGYRRTYWIGRPSLIVAVLRETSEISSLFIRLLSASSPHIPFKSFDSPTITTKSGLKLNEEIYIVDMEGSTWEQM